MVPVEARSTVSDAGRVSLPRVETPPAQRGRTSRRGGVVSNPCRIQYILIEELSEKGRRPDPSL